MAASAVPFGAISSVNQATYGTQADARTAALPDGGYAVVWVNHDAQGADQLPAAGNLASDIRLRLFNADGSARGDDIAVNSGDRGWQVAPDLAVTADGRIAISWTDGAGFYSGAEHPGSSTGGDGGGSQAVRLRLFSNSGQALTPEQLVNQTTLQDQRNSKLVALADGRVLVAWEDGSSSINSQGAGGGPMLKARLYAASGGPLGSEIGWAGDWNYAPTPVALSGGGWAAVWLSAYYMDPAALKARVFDRAGGALDTERAWSTGGSAGAQWDTAALTGGQLALAWTLRDPAAGDGSGRSVVVQLIKADGSLSGAAFVANTTTAADQENVQVAALAGGGFVVAWESTTPPDATGHWTRQLRAQVFDSQGRQQGSEQRVEADDASLQLNDLVALDDGGFVLGWTGRSWVDVHVRAYGAGGQPLGDTVVVHGAGGWQNQARLTALHDGAFAVTWATAYDGYNGGDGNGPGLQTRSFVTHGLQLVGSTAADQLRDSPLDDRIDAGAGNDRIRCSGGHDVVAGGAGVDTLVLPVPLADVLAHLEHWTLQPGAPTAGATSLGTLDLSGIERIRLDDALFAFDTLPQGKTWQAAALYHAAFGSLPAVADLSRWTAVADGCADMPALATAMLNRFVPDGLAPAALVAHLHTRLTGQAADADLVARYAAQVGPGQTWADNGALWAWAASLDLNTEALLLPGGVPFVGSLQTLDAADFGL